MCWPMKTIFACGLRTFRPSRASVRVLDASVQSGLLRGLWHTTARLRSVVSECLPVQKVGHVAVVAEIAYAFGTDDVAAPSGGDEMVEFVNVECRTAVVNESTDAVFFHFTPFVMVMMMVSVRFFSSSSVAGFSIPRIHPAEVATRSKSNRSVWIIFFKSTSA